MSNNIPSTRSETRYFMIGLVLVWLVYAVLTFLAPAAESVTRYGLTPAQTNLIRATIVFPLLFIWVTAMLGVLYFRRYARLLGGAAESGCYLMITKGLWMLLLVVVVPSLVSLLASYFPESHSIQKYTTITRNYLSVGLYLVSFWYFWKASTGLLKQVPSQNRNQVNYWATLGVLALTIVYLWIVFQNPFRSASTDPLVMPTYYLPDALILSTIILPYALIWLLGILAILNIRAYARQVPGIVYRQTFSYLSYGFTITVLLLIFLQFLSQANYSLGHAALRIILPIIYLLLLAIAVGYLLIARGAGKLAKIEEVE